MNVLRVLICGDRNWNNTMAVEKMVCSISRKDRDAVIIHGAAKGADSMAGFYAKKYGLQVLSFPAEWEKHGKAAGPIRNQQMLDEGNPSIVIAFHHDLTKSKGTKDMVNRALKDAGVVEVKIIKGVEKS